MSVSSSSSFQMKETQIQTKMGNTHPIDSTSGISRGEDAQRDSHYEVPFFLLPPSRI
jgi:hypothetical protein